MNNLHRELAPISDAAWAQIEEETRRTLKRIPRRTTRRRRRGAGRPWSFRDRHRPPQADRWAWRGDPGATTRGQASGRIARSVRARSRADRRRRARLEQFRLAAGEGRCTKNRLRGGSRHLRGLCGRSDRRHPAGDEQSHHDAAGRCASVSGCDRPGVEPIASRRRQWALCGRAWRGRLHAALGDRRQRLSGAGARQEARQRRDHLGPGYRRRLRAYQTRRRFRPAHRAGRLDRLSEPHRQRRAPLPSGDADVPHAHL